MNVDSRLRTEYHRGHKRLSRGYCPHCDHRVAFLDPPNGTPSWAYSETRHDPQVGEDERTEHSFIIGLCPNAECGRPTIVYESVSSYPGFHDVNDVDRLEIAYPPASGQTIHSDDVPADLRALYAEAGRIESLSPNGAAFLARRLLERILRTQLDSKDRLADLIDRYLDEMTLPGELHELMHDVRQFGNIAGHAGVASDGDLVNVEAGEATYVLDVVGELIDFVYVRPTRQQAMRARWEAKKRGERPDLDSDLRASRVRVEPDPGPVAGTADVDDDLPF